VPRKPRPIPLEPHEKHFRLDRWVVKHMTVLEQNGPEWIVICPWCYSEKLAVHVGRKAWQCFSGGCSFAGWSPIKLVAETLNVSYARAKEIVASAALGVNLGPVESLIELEPEGIRRDLPQATLPPTAWRLAPTQWTYAIGRGIAPEHIYLFKLGTILSSGRGSKADRSLSGRIMFPIWDTRGVLVSWVARAVGPSKAKTINMPRSCRELNHGAWCTCYHEEWGLAPVPMAAESHEVVLGINLVTPGAPVVIVEGPVDAAVCGPGFVATLGAKISLEQAGMIARSGASEAIILFDGDEGGVKGSATAGAILSQALPTRIAICPWGVDPGSLGRQVAMQIAMSAPTAGTPASLRQPRPTKLQVPRCPPPFQDPLDG
jgi:hypothetical protein